MDVGGRTYSVACNPARGTVPEPKAICRALGRWPELLVDGPGIWHSCPPSPVRKLIRVSGTYRGYPVHASFADTTCGWVPGQDGALAEWSGLMSGAGPGSRARPFTAEPVRYADPRRAARLRRDARRLTRQRAKGGSSRLDPLALRIIREQVDSNVLAGGPLVAEADVYATSLVPDHPVFVVVYHYAYRDYAGRRHPATDGITYSVLDARSLDLGEWGTGDVPGQGTRGRPVTLTF